MLLTKRRNKMKKEWGLSTKYGSDKVKNRALAKKELEAYKKMWLTEQEAIRRDLERQNRSWFSTHNEYIGLISALFAGLLAGAIIGSMVVGDMGLDRANAVYDKISHETTLMRYKAIESKEFLSDAVDIYTSDEYILKKIKAERLKLYVESRFLDNIKKELEHCYGEK
jgi:hypothetical protein